MTGRKRLVVDANILLRAVFGVRARSLVYAHQDSVDFYAPEICFEDARRYIPAVAAKRQVKPTAGFATLEGLAGIIESVDFNLYAKHEVAARLRISARDVSDWPIVATALLFNCPVWTEDRDFFGSGLATWTTANVELYLGDE